MHGFDWMIISNFRCRRLFSDTALAFILWLRILQPQSVRYALDTEICFGARLTIVG